ncbi:hypothetical protein KTF36_17965 [Burkholderia gladioli]|uniref:hypothetical protein n=1 Tax=Burkholderia gladioli TaxID=28095 RepID=UPI001C2235AC|nr:hypothetical protein [Burkholderia gladioli]MBU9643739.1 hypothetical protein [Burkholderia gladioli]
MSKESAKALHERQRHYDELHHLMRMEWLSDERPRYADGVPMPKHEAKTLRNLSTECLRLIQQHGMRTNSVDLDDTEYIRELDAFAARKGDTR